MLIDSEVKNLLIFTQATLQNDFLHLLDSDSLMTVIKSETGPGFSTYTDPTNKMNSSWCSHGTKW